MALVATTDGAMLLRRHHVLPNGTGYYRSNFIGRDSAVASEGPTCYLIEQAPSSTIRPHFHRANQFQVVVSGHGTLGREQVSPLIVHYAAAYTPYGPIVSEEDGIHYFTIRDAFDPGASWMPDSRSELPKRPRRHVTSSPLAMANDPQAAAADLEVAMVGPDADGLAAIYRQLPPHGRAAGHAPSEGGGQFHLLLSGSIVHDGRELAPYASIYLGSDEQPIELFAGPAGAAVLMLRFPRRPADA
jgi:hypothetical protein